MITAFFTIVDIHFLHLHFDGHPLTHRSLSEGVHLYLFSFLLFHFFAVYELHSVSFRRSIQTQCMNYLQQLSRFLHSLIVLRVPLDTLSKRINSLVHWLYNYYMEVLSLLHL